MFGLPLLQAELLLEVVYLPLQVQVFLCQLLPLFVGLALGGPGGVFLSEQAELRGHVFVAVPLGGEERSVHVFDEVQFVGGFAGVSGGGTRAIVAGLCAGGPRTVRLGLVVRHRLKIKLMIKII